MSAAVYREPYLYANDKSPPEFAAKFDKQFHRPQYSIHPYRNAVTGRRQVYNTSKKRRLK